MKKLTNSQIKDLLKQERQQSVNPYRDEVDLTIDRLVNLYEENKINEMTLKALISLVLTSTMKDTVSGLHNDLVKRSFLNIQNSEPNKLLFVNYSRKNYA